MKSQRPWSAPPHRMPKIPKVREYAQIKMSDGVVLTDYMFVDATARIQDILNSANNSLPFMDGNEVISLLNKGLIIHVRPFDT